MSRVHYDQLMHFRHSQGLVTVGDTAVGPLPGPVGGVIATFKRGATVNSHCHEHAQLVYAADGTMSVETDNARWLVPPNRAVWLPPMVNHSFRMATDIQTYTLYVTPGLSQIADLTACSVIQVSSVLKALVERVCDFTAPYTPDSPEGRLVDVLLDEIRIAPATGLYVAFPRDVRLFPMVQAISTDPGDCRTLEAWAELLGASERTIARHFRDETGMSFIQWRQQVRLFKALQLLAEDVPVNSVAQRCGYESASAFIGLFRKNFGITPSRYFARTCGELSECAAQ